MKKIVVMVAGLSNRSGKGKMAKLIAQAIASQKDMKLYPYALSEDTGFKNIKSVGRIKLIPVEEHKSFLEHRRDKIDLIVDCTLPRSVNTNAEMYCAARIPFVMLTTGGDRKKLVRTIKKSKTSALITTNASPRVVALLEMIKFGAKKFPEAFKGFKRLFEESHQSTKADPSGTMVGMLPYFSALVGATISKDEIKMERDPLVQHRKLRIPKKYLGGHGFHTYTLISPDRKVKVQVIHNLLGRSDYVEGTLLDIRFVYRHRKEKGKVFWQVDALQGV